MRKTVPIADGVAFGGDGFVIVAGPCAVESREQVMTTARVVAEAGAVMLRGGAFKPRTSPKSFQGMGHAGLALLAEAGAATGLPVVTEVMDPREVEAVASVAAMLQIGSRNMQNFPLLREVGRTRKPVLLKRGASATIDELLNAADYILQGGNELVVLCERGVRSFDTATRYLLDLAAVAVLRERTELPVVVDPSHGTGKAAYVPAMTRAAAAAGADGVIIEVHPNPEAALSDGPQALRPHEFAQLVSDLRRIVPLVGRRVLRSTGAQPAPNPNHATEVIAP